MPALNAKKFKLGHYPAASDLWLVASPRLLSVSLSLITFTER